MDGSAFGKWEMEPSRKGRIYARGTQEADASLSREQKLVHGIRDARPSFVSKGAEKIRNRGAVAVAADNYRIRDCGRPGGARVYHFRNAQSQKCRLARSARKALYR